jgi:hypothetical protein
MKDSSFNRWLWLIGLAIVVLIFISFAPLSSGQPKENASGTSVIHWYNTHQNQQWLTVWLVGLALFLLLVYITQLRSVLIESGGGQRLFPNIMFASGILFVSGIVISGSFTITLLLAAHNHDVAVAHFINFYEQNNELLLLAGMVFITLSAGLAILLNRTEKQLPKLLGWYSLLVAVVGSAGPVSLLAFLFGFPVWLIATGIVISRKKGLGDEPGGGASVGARVDAVAA